VGFDAVEHVDVHGVAAWFADVALIAAVAFVAFLCGAWQARFAFLTFLALLDGHTGEGRGNELVNIDRLSIGALLTRLPGVTLLALGPRLGRAAFDDLQPGHDRRQRPLKQIAHGADDVCAELFGVVRHGVGLSVQQATGDAAGDEQEPFVALITSHRPRQHVAAAADRLLVWDRVGRNECAGRRATEPERMQAAVATSGRGVCWC
jgi:hypothetical protein